jgi:signal peptidase I
LGYIRKLPANYLQTTLTLSISELRIRTVAKKTTLPKVASTAAPVPTVVVAKKQVNPQGTRESIESIVIAFILAFLFRTFSAEAFVIPTGSMAPTLMGMHKDVECSQCGQRYQVSASQEADDQIMRKFEAEQRAGRRGGDAMLVTKGIRTASQTVSGACPNCQHVMAYRTDLDPVIVRPKEPIEDQSTYGGDRIIVNKFAYALRDPERWDVVVFKFPGNAQMNYIKRLVGLPGETLRVQSGDIFTTTSNSEADFKIARKPPHKVLAMRQVVHDTAHDPLTLYEAKWPLRWSDAAGVWKREVTADAPLVEQSYNGEAGAKQAWLRYRHIVPEQGVWNAALEGRALDPAVARPRLITDQTAYNTELERSDARLIGGVGVPWYKLGLHWVGDLMVEADVELQSDTGEVVLEVVEGGVHFQCVFDVATGAAKLQALPFEGAEPFAGLAATAESPLSGVGTHTLRMANFDNEILVWVDGKLLDFGGKNAYSAAELFGSNAPLPRTSAADEGDLAPGGLAIRNARATVTHLRVWRDLYYIATNNSTARSEPMSDYDQVTVNQMSQLPAGELMGDSENWSLLARRRYVTFALTPDQLFVMGDNSAASMDCRLWYQGDNISGRPGGAYLDRHLLIGKATFVYWPHSWNRIPGTPIPFPLFPNVADMRLIR